MPRESDDEEQGRTFKQFLKRTECFVAWDLLGVLRFMHGNGAHTLHKYCAQPALATTEHVLFLVLDNLDACRGFTGG